MNDLLHSHYNAVLVQKKIVRRQDFHWRRDAILCSDTLLQPDSREIVHSLLFHFYQPQHTHLKYLAFQMESICQKLAKRIKFSFHLITWLSLSRCATDVHAHNENRKMKVKGYLEYVSENIYNLISKYCYFCGRDVKMTLFLWRLFIVFMREFFFSWKWWKYFPRNEMKMKWLMLAMSACA